MNQNEFIEYLLKEVFIYPDNFKNDGKYQEFYKNGLCYFRYNIKYDFLYCSYDNVWGVFRKKYNLNDHEIYNLFKEMLVNIFKMIETTIRIWF